jgi:hypothetical protein
MKLSRRAMLMKYTRGMYGAKINEKQVEEEAEQKHGTKKGMVRATKHLLPEDALDDCNQRSSKARKYFYQNTLPYDDKGWRIVKTNNYFDTLKTLREMISEIEIADRNFLAQYPALREQVRADLNGLFKESDYPDVEEVKKRFYAKVKTLPLPDVSNYPGDMQSIMDDLSKDLEEREKEITTNAMNDVWGRLYGVVKKAADTLSDKESSFKDTLITNISELCEVLPRINLMDDPDLERMRQEVISKLTNYNPEDLRQKNGKGFMEQGIRAGHRKAVATEAQKILDEMAAYFTPSPEEVKKQEAKKQEKVIPNALGMILS